MKLFGAIVDETFALASVVAIIASCDGFVGEVTVRGAKETANPETPVAFVESFYNEYPHRLTGGLPAGDDLRWIRPKLSDRLYDSFVSTLEYQRAWMERHPARPSPNGGPPTIFKPPFSEGIPFDGSPDGHKAFKVVSSAQTAPDTWKVRVRFWYDPSLEGWEHVVMVKSERGRYVMDDIVFTPNAPNEPPALLSEILASRDF